METPTINLSTRKARISAILCAVITICSFAAEITYTALTGNEYRKQRPHMNSTDTGGWDLPLLQFEWKFRTAIIDAQIISIFFNIIALGLFVHVVFTIKKIYRLDRSWLKNGLLYSFGIAFFLSMLKFLNFLGVAFACQAVVSSNNVPYEAYVAAEVVWRVALGVTGFLYAIQVVLMAFGLLCCYLLTYRAGGNPKNRLTIGAGVFSLLTSVFGFLAFILQFIAVLAVDSFSNPLTIAALILTNVFNFIMIPIWLIWVGILLGNREVPDDGELRSLQSNQQL